MLDPNRYLVISWDWKSQVPVDDLNTAIHAGFLWLYTPSASFTDDHHIIAAKEAGLSEDYIDELYMEWDTTDLEDET